MIAVSAGIVVRDGRIMLCRRLDKGDQALKWEFPGGKLEKGESPEGALERELMEELKIRTRTGRIYDVKFHSSGERDILLLFFRSELLGGEPEPVECSAVTFALPGELMSFDLAPADREVAQRIAEEGL